MDPEANLKEQQEVAAEVMKVWDRCDEEGHLTFGQLSDLAELASRLAELVLSLAEWKKKGGYSPV